MISEHLNEKSKHTKPHTHLKAGLYIEITGSKYFSLIL